MPPADPTTDVRRQCEQALSAAAHDLREPLRAVTAWIELLRDHLGGRIDRQASQYLDQALACASRGRSLIGDLLDLARAEGDRSPLEDVPLELALAEALGNLAASLDETQARVDVAPLPVVRARRVDVVRVLQNVVANALAARRGPAPLVRVRAESLRGDDGQSMVRLRIEDDGVGLDAADAERAFEPFARLQPDHPGTGLGLTLCRRLVESHGGAIDLQPGDEGGAVCVVSWAGARQIADSLTA